MALAILHSVTHAWDTCLDRRPRVAPILTVHTYKYLFTLITLAGPCRSAGQMAWEARFLRPPAPLRALLGLRRSVLVTG